MFKKNNKNGMIMIMVIGILVFVMIIFASLVNRVRHETSVTMKVSLNERLYQIASAVGRLAVRKLQTDFETRDQEYSKKILDAAFAGKTGVIEGKDYSDVVRNLDVVKEIITRFKSKWGDISFTVKYIPDLGKAMPFRRLIAGLKSSPYERKGHIDVVVDVTHMGVTKTCRIRKEFLLVNLLPQPFHRFTLFSPRGAAIGQNVANNTFVDDNGQLKNNRPFLCYNRLLRSKKKNQEGLDFRFNRADNIVKTIDGKPSFVKSGWIYLGGRGVSTDLKGDSGNLILSVNAGSKDDGGNNDFGEFFNFYFDKQSAGWLIARDWTNWLNSQIPSNNLGNNVSKVMISFVDYGYFKGLWNITIPNTHHGLFIVAKRIYENRSGVDIDRGSSMHLFGTPGLCTPTLIFGKVKRRYVRTFALYFPEKQRVYPLRTFTQHSSLNMFATQEIYNWYNNTWGSSAVPAFINDFVSIFTTGGIDVPKYRFGMPANSPPLSGIAPEIRDWEPYMESLKNICDPGGPDRKWTAVVPNNDYVKNSSDELCKEDYRFKNDKEIFYTGDIRQLTINDKYLKDRMSYYIGEKGKTNFILSKCDFFKNKFITKVKGKNRLFLNSIVGFKGNLVIDMPLEIGKGGIIICDGSISVKAPIINPYIANPPTTPDAYGYLTLISRKGITISAGQSVPGSSLPQTHGFFISLNNGNGRISVTKPLHIVGGVASDQIDDLVKKGCIIEWGLEPKEVTGDNCFSCRDYYGFSMGPRDTEIITEE